MKNTIYIALIFCFACANVIAPSGGEKDITPPKVIRTTPPNNSNNFNKEEISIEFDELVQFNDEKNIFTSPYNKDGVEATISKNKLKINFKTNLKENTTYNINLNGLIKDVNEGNILENLNYQFSTGKHIDSLSISGTVKDALTGMSMKEVWVVLYNDDMDSALYKETPLHVVKSSDLGDFVFSNLPNRSFAMYAIQDLDDNLRFSIPNEKVGFYPNKVESEAQEIEILLFDETAVSDSISSLHSDTITNKYGKLIIDSLPQNSHLIIELLKDEKVVIRKKASFPTQIDSLLAGSYSLRIIEDKNQNGVWDSGKLNRKILAEMVKVHSKAINIREDWDIIIEWDAN